MNFEFVEFNPRRALRGADAARVRAIYEDGTDDVLWMSKRDIAKNMMAFGRCAELLKAHQAYASGVAYSKDAESDSKNQNGLQAEACNPLISKDNLAEWTGLEPATPGVTGRSAK